MKVKGACVARRAVPFVTRVFRAVSNVPSQPLALRLLPHDPFIQTPLRPLTDPCPRTASSQPRAIVSHNQSLCRSVTYSPRRRRVAWISLQTPLLPLAFVC